MYISGSYGDYESRIHQFGSQLESYETGVDLFSGFNQFVIEGSGYVLSGYPDTNMAYKWEREARISKFRLEQSGVYLNTSILSTGILI